MPLEPPPCPFDRLALAVRTYCDKTAMAVAAGEVMAARAGNAPSFVQSLKMMQDDAVMFGQLFAWLRDLAEHEEEFRDLMAGFAARMRQSHVRVAGRIA